MNDDDAELFVKPIPYHESWAGPAERKENYKRYKEVSEKVAQDVKRIQDDRPTGPTIPPEFEMTAGEFARAAGSKKRNSPQLEQVVIDLLEGVYLIRLRLQERRYNLSKLVDGIDGIKRVDLSPFPTLSEGELGAIKDLKELIDRCMK